MKKQMNIEEVLTFSESLELKKVDFLEVFNPFIIASNLGVSIFIVLIFGMFFFMGFLLVFAILAKEFQKGSFLENFIFGGVLLAIVVGVGISVTNGNEVALLTSESQQEYQSMESKWVRELATPYLEQLPLESVTGIAKVEYDYELETVTTAPPRHQVPIKVTTTKGDTYRLWAKVVELEEAVPSILTFTTLSQDLVFHEYADVAFKKGYYNGTIYTSVDL